MSTQTTEGGIIINGYTEDGVFKPINGYTTPPMLAAYVTLDKPHRHRDSNKDEYSVTTIVKKDSALGKALLNMMLALYKKVSGADGKFERLKFDNNFPIFDCAEEKGWDGYADYYRVKFKTQHKPEVYSPKVTLMDNAHPSLKSGMLCRIDFSTWTSNKGGKPTVGVNLNRVQLTGHSGETIVTSARADVRTSGFAAVEGYDIDDGPFGEAEPESESTPW